MQQILNKIFADVVGALRYRWHGILFAWIVCIVGWVVVALIPNRYESKAVVYIDTATVLQPLLQDLAVNSNVMSEVRMMTEVLLSRPQLERVARDTDLDLRAKTPEQMEGLLDRIRSNIRVSAGAAQGAFGEQNLYTIQFTDNEPQTVYAVVQSLLEFFVETSLGQKKEDSVGAQRFLEEQIQQYEVRLTEAEQKLAEFKRGNVGLMPSEGQDYYQRLSLAIDERDRVREEYAQVEKRRDELQKQIDGEEPTFGLLASPDSLAEDSEGDSSQVQEYEQELATLLLKYTEKHPKVVELQNRIEQLKSVNAARAREQDNKSPTFILDSDLVNMNSLDLNPVYQSLRISISQANAELSEIGSKLSSAQSKVDYLREMVDTMPEVEAQLARLNRDYEVNKTQHTALLKRLESARLSEDAEFRSEEIKFRIIEPPVVPLTPNGPNRPLFATAVLVFGFGLGGALAYFLSLVNPVFNSTTDLRHGLHLPVLGTVSRFQSDEEKRDRRRDHRKLAFAATGLLIVYGVSLLWWPLTDVLRELIANAKA